MAGRPRKKPEEVHRRLHVTLSPANMQKLKDLAKAMDFSESHIVQMAIVRWHRVEFPQKEGKS